ncbi:MAG: glycosyltransferase family 4 protein [Chloroflexaceae bacterium]|nr:glycosyltransferase family 4 protein [Chloroflexaceae bacterium]
MTISATNPPRLLFVVTEDQYFWMHRLALARAVRDAGCEVVVATPSGPFQKRIEAEGFLFYPLRLRRKIRNPWVELLTILDLYSLFRLARPDLVHLVEMKPILYGTLPARLARVPARVHAITGLGYVFIGNGWKRTLLRTGVEWGFRFAFWGKHVRAIFHNPDDREVFTTRHLLRESQAVWVMGSGVDTEVFAPASELPGEPVVLLASRMLWDKGIGELVEAARLLKKRGVPGKFVLAGVPDPDNPASIPETHLRSWNEEGVVEWIGFHNDMPSLLAQSHIVCLPSYREGASRALIEAASCGRPIVTTDVPGCRDLVRDGWNGLLVPVKDAVALADVLQTLLTNGEMRREMGQHGRELALARFDKAIIIRDTFAVYQSLLGGRFCTGAVRAEAIQNVEPVSRILQA